MTVMLERPTSPTPMETPDGPPGFEAMCRTLLSMDVPDGRAGVAVYLLLDMAQESATVFSQPSETGYTSRTTVPFGKTIHVPAPFDCELDTGGFGAPPERTGEQPEGD